MDNFYVYQYLREFDSADGVAGTPYYIGKGRNKRKTSNSRVVPKPKNPKFITVVASDLSELEALQMEMRLIVKYGRLDLGTGCLRNMTDGGEGGTGFKPSPELRALWSSQRRGNKFRLGKLHSVETRERMSNSHRGIKRPPEFGEKIRQKLVGVPKSPECCKNISLAKRGKPTKPNKGRTGQPWSEEQKRKISEGMKRRWNEKRNASSNP